VIEVGGKLLPVEVKSTARPRLSDAAHLRTFRAEYGKKARAGLFLHTGNAIEWLAPDVLAAPWWTSVSGGAAADMDSFDIYRPQVEFFGGKCDGKFWRALNRTLVFSGVTVSETIEWE